MKPCLLGLLVLSASYFGMGVSDAGAQSCAPASECVCSPASTLIHASSVVETDQGEAFEVQVLEVFGADIGATHERLPRRRANVRAELQRLDQ